MLALGGLLDACEFDEDRMRAAADVPTAAAIDLAEHLVRGGMPFREAHAVVGSLVRQSIERHIPLQELVEAEPHLGPDALELLEPGNAVRARTTPGGAGPVPLVAQLDAARDQVRRQLQWLDG